MQSTTIRCRTIAIANGSLDNNTPKSGGYYDSASQNR